MISRRQFLKISAAAGVGVTVPWRLGMGRAFAQVVAQTPLAGSAIPQFVDPLPALHTIIAGTGQIELRSTEFQSPVMPSTFVPATGAYNGTWVWGYKDAGGQSATAYIGPVIVAERGTPTQIKWVNELGNTGGSNVLAWTQSTDQTLHWADPLHPDMPNMCAHQGVGYDAYCSQHYAGPIPDVTHLHGGEVPAEIDGGPDAWYTSDGNYHGAAYYAGPGGGGNSTVFRYPNTQEAASIWFHPHPLGVTRLNVYAGLAGAYLITDPGLNLPANLPGPADIVPLVIQDRSFDVNGQLYFPNVGINPEHPFWIPELVGDTIVVNGKVWPFKNLEAKRYRFLFLNGSNARTYEMFLTNPVTKVNGPAMWVIGTDGGYLDTPVKIDPALGQKLVLMPGERYDVIIDFTGFAGQTLLLRNTGRTPFPKGASPQGTTLGRVMQFRIGAAPAGGDGSYDPASGTPLRSGEQVIVRLADPVAGTLAAGVTAQKTRQLTLNEVMGPGGPLEVLVNNTKWDGMRTDPASGDRVPIPDSTDDGIGNYLTEMPVEGQTEVWEIINLTADAHPIHLHLVQFQLINRQSFNVNKYTKVYDGLFPASVQIDPMTGLPYPGGVFIGAFGPPNAYDTPNADGAVGGNPAISGYLQGPAKPPLPQEAGWKDTVIMYPGEVTRIAVRWAPTELGLGLESSVYAFPFDPSKGDYVWHCHILDHEDNEMMRPDKLTPKAGVTRSLTGTKDGGSDY
jgi:spore coat protein A